MIKRDFDLGMNRSFTSIRREYMATKSLLVTQRFYEEAAAIGYLPPRPTREDWWDHEPDLNTRENVKYRKQTREQRTAFNKRKYQRSKLNRKAAGGFPPLPEWLGANYPQIEPVERIRDLPEPIAKDYRRQLWEHRQSFLRADPNYVHEKKVRRVTKSDIVNVNQIRAEIAPDIVDPEQNVHRDVIVLDITGGLPEGFHPATRFTRNHTRLLTFHKELVKRRTLNPNLSVKEFYCQLETEGELPHNRVREWTTSRKDAIVGNGGQLGRSVYQEGVTFVWVKRKMSLSNFYEYFRKMDVRGMAIPKRARKPVTYKSKYVKKGRKGLKKGVMIPAYASLLRFSDPRLTFKQIAETLIQDFGVTMHPISIQLYIGKKMTLPKALCQSDPNQGNVYRD